MASTVGEFLASINLAEYSAAFDKEGWDDMKALHDMPDELFQQLVASVKMKTGHAARLRLHLAPGSFNASAAPAAAPAAPQQPPPPPPNTTAGTEASPPPPQASAAAPCGKCQQEVVNILTSAGLLGEPKQGNLIDTFRAGSEPVIRVVSKNQFYCICCPVVDSDKGAGERDCGNGYGNLLKHLGSKCHWTNHRKFAFGLEYDDALWLKYTMGNTKGPSRAKRTKAAVDLLRDRMERGGELSVALVQSAHIPL